MSATLNAELFAQYFKGKYPRGDLQVPIIEIPGRTYPVEQLFLEDVIELTYYTIEETSPYARRDDFKQKVSHIVRGDDLLSSTGRQILIYRMLGLSPLPRYYHLPIVCGPDGRRLAKRHGDSRVASYREKGISPFRVVGLIAFWCRITEQRQLMSASEFAEKFCLEMVPRHRITFSYKDEQWLCG